MTRAPVGRRRDRGLADGLAFPGQSHHRVRSRGVDSEHDRHPTPTSQRAARVESDALGRATVNRRKESPCEVSPADTVTHRRAAVAAALVVAGLGIGAAGRRRRGGGRGGQVRPGGDHNGAGEKRVGTEAEEKAKSVGTEAEERVESVQEQLEEELQDDDGGGGAGG